jgi:hypothetical protein
MPVIVWLSSRSVESDKSMLSPFRRGLNQLPPPYLQSSSFKIDAMEIEFQYPQWSGL